MASNNISLSDSLLAEIQVAAQAEDRTVEAVLQDAVKKYLDDRSWTKLIAYGRERARVSQYQGEEGIDRAISEYRAEKHGR